MQFGQSAWWGQGGFDARGAREAERVRREFWHKARRVVAGLPFAEDLLAAYYCAFDHATPMPVKASLVGALAYFVLPFDAMPDVFPLLGFTDDAAVLLTALRMVGAHMRPEHRDAARAALARMKAGRR
ncbi:MAG TPA: YkvA family protein [Xanthobacteraceae bacterium]|nr:YkvA family protein [Xanthobacteraceae bacterium]